MEKDKERLKVIENIKQKLKEGKLNDKVELNDPIITEEERQKEIINFDIMRKNPIKKIKRIVARNIANNYTKLFNSDTEIIGLENMKELKTGAIITTNHFSHKDSTMIIYANKKAGKKKSIDIIIEEENVIMKGQFRFLLRNCGTIPISESKEYMSNKFMPAIKELLRRKHFILIYPEEQMWFNYRKPRTCKIGAYHLAAKNNVPILPCFVAMEERKDEYEEDGFNKLKYTLYIMSPIYPDKNKDIKTNKKEMQKKDYESKVKAYEMAYNKKLTYDFKNSDIAGYTE